MVFGRRPESVAASAQPTPARSQDPFSFEVEDLFTITGRGTVITGIVRGRISVGDNVAFKTPSGDRLERRVIGIEMFRKIVQTANEGETVGLLLSTPIAPAELPRGTVVQRA
jgi:elongation factor Tu